MKKWMLNCRTATELIEKRHREQLSLSERWKLFTHALMCSACRQYKKQSLWLERLFRIKQESNAPATNTEGDKSTQLENKILERIQQDMK